MAIFHCYVSSPEGTQRFHRVFQIQRQLNADGAENAVIPGQTPEAPAVDALN